MTKKKIARTKRGTKEKPVDAEIRRAAERAGVSRRRTAKVEPTFVVSADTVNRWRMLLRRAQREAIEAAPRRLPLRGDGTAAAICAYDSIRYVLMELTEIAIEQAAWAEAKAAAKAGGAR